MNDDLSDGLFEGETKRKWIMIILVVLLLIASLFLFLYLNEFTPPWLLPFAVVVGVSYQLGKISGRDKILDELKKCKTSELLDTVVQLIRKAGKD